MTAEIAVLNKDAVALAADSTVTVSGKKTYQTTNKLFALSKCHPVGVMIYGSGELAGVPWETLIKLYRKNLGSSAFDTLIEYKDDFIKFLEKDIDEYNSVDEREMILEYSEDYMEVLVDEIDRAVETIIEEKGNITDPQVGKILRSFVLRHEKSWESHKKLDFTSAKMISGLKKTYSPEIEKIIGEKLENHRISKTYINKIVGISINIFCSKLSEISGVVVSGFGEKDLFPSLSTCHIECIVRGRIKHRIDNTFIKNTVQDSATIVPFAQTDTVATFMEGISKKMHDVVIDGLNGAFGDYKEKIREEMLGKGIPKAKVNQIFKSMEKTEENIENKLASYLMHSRYVYHIGPVIEAVQYLPKNEMAEVAESLVSITSFRQKISLEQESVGGAIDVAVISKSDGFVWIKRKHYFEADLNPMFFSKYISEKNGAL